MPSPNSDAKASCREGPNRGNSQGMPHRSAIRSTLFKVVELSGEYRLGVPRIRGRHKVVSYNDPSNRSGPDLLMLSSDPLPYQTKRVVFNDVMCNLGTRRINSPRNPLLFSRWRSRRKSISQGNFPRDSEAVTAASFLALHVLRQPAYLAASETLTGRPTTMPDRIRSGLYARPNHEARW